MTKRLRDRLSYANVMATGAMFIALGGSAWASGVRASPSSANAPAGGSIHACVRNADGSVRIVSSAGRCTRGEHSLTWNLSGPRGHVGATGSAGLQGAPGPQGPAGPVVPTGIFSGRYASPSGASVLQVTDSGITLTQTGATGSSTITLSGGDLVIDDAATGASLRLTSDSGAVALTAGGTLTTTAGGNIATTSNTGNITTTASQGNIVTTAALGNVATTASTGAVSSTGAQDITDTVGANDFRLDTSGASINAPSVSLGGTTCPAGVARVGDPVANGTITSGSLKVGAC